MESGSGSSSGSDSGSSSGSESGLSSGSESGSSSSPVGNRRQKRPRTSTGIDRLSDLPDSVICHILSFLPVEKVVATSILSTRWRFLWADVTSLDVQFDRICSFDSRYPRNRIAKDAEFAQIVNKILLLRNADRLDKFRLRWETTFTEAADYVNIWVSYAFARKLRYFDLYREQISVGGTIPGTLFTCETLEFLNLSGPFTLQVPNKFCLPKLEEIILTFPFNKSDESIPNILSGCPVLHSLTIDCVCAYDMDLKIPSPSLRHLVVTHDPDFEEYLVYDRKLEIDAPHLESLSLQDGWYDCSIKRPSTLLDKVFLDLGDNCCAESHGDFVNGIYSDRCNLTVKLVGNLNCAKCLTLKGSVMMAISHATIPLSSRFERLTQLKIDVSTCQLSSLNVLLGCCIRLQFLSMTRLGYCNHNHNHSQCWKDPTQVPECLLSSLAHVSFHLFTGSEDEMSMVRYILKHSSVLESLSVSTRYSNKFQMLQTISKFTRLSSACSVEFS